MIAVDIEDGLGASASVVVDRVKVNPMGKEAIAGAARSHGV